MSYHTIVVSLSVVSWTWTRRWDSLLTYQGVDYYKAPVQGACNKEGEDCPQTASRSGEPMQLVDRVGPDERPSKPNVPPGPPPRKDLQQRRLSSTG